MTKDDAAREAVTTLGYLTIDAIPTIARLLEDEMVTHPRTIMTAYRAEGDQLSPPEKRALGLRSNAFLSRQALSEITESGRADVLKAHETTLLRATFTMGRLRHIANVDAVRESLGVCFVGYVHTTVHELCPACNKLDNLVVMTSDAVAVMPPADCAPGCTASYTVQAKIDWLAGAE